MRFPKSFSTPLPETTPAASIKAQMTTPRLNSDIAESTRCTKMTYCSPNYREPAPKMDSTISPERVDKTERRVSLSWELVSG